MEDDEYMEYGVAEGDGKLVELSHIKIIFLLCKFH